ncbi:IdeS/Mac family cysteine endopeptidase [Bacteroides pyogenes]|nr:IdeS/Mac family cysteine endopeptidase [Bacteroides pyogenes]GAE21490.1 hypothetical protein JCM10003_950 [Bacteroides pyogenes JCM 10003]
MNIKTTIQDFMKQFAKVYYCAVLFLISLYQLLLTGCEHDEYFGEKQPEVEIGQEKPEENKTDNSASMEHHVFAKGVTVEHGWHDVDKLKRPQDVMACWLITASNMLQWWQDRYIEEGCKLPEGTPNGKGIGPYRSAIFDDAITKFVNLNNGGNITNGLLWYVEGKNADITGHAYPVPNTGGYLKKIQGRQLEYGERFFLSYDDWGKMTTEKEALRVFSESLIKRLKTGAAIGVDIKTHVGVGGMLHAITLWGAEVNNENEVTSVYITDSDDYEHQLVRCPIEACNNEIYNSKEIAMKIPAGKAYDKGATWAIMRLFYLSPPKLTHS